MRQFSSLSNGMSEGSTKEFVYDVNSITGLKGDFEYYGNMMKDCLKFVNKYKKYNNNNNKYMGDLPDKPKMLIYEGNNFDKKDLDGGIVEMNEDFVSFCKRYKDFLNNSGKIADFLKKS